MDIRFDQAGFTALELMVILSIVTMIMTQSMVSIRAIRFEARDNRRVADIRFYANAMEDFFTNHLRYPIIPVAQRDWVGKGGGYDHSLDGVFLQELKDEGAIISAPLDPLNRGVHCDPELNEYCYRYFYYSTDASWDQSGHQSEIETVAANCGGSFYILGISLLETERGKNGAFGNNFTCGGYNWDGQFHYLLGAFE